MANNWSTVRAVNLDNGEENLRVGILSDTHGFIDSRIEQALAGCDVLLHAGDICGAHILERLCEIAPRVLAIAGNNDTPELWSEAEQDEVVSLAGMLKIALPGGELVMEHGHRFGGNPDHGAFRGAWPSAKAVIYGHTHKVVFDDADDIWVANPGAAGRERVGEGPSCMLLDIVAGQWSLSIERFAKSQQCAVA